MRSESMSRMQWLRLRQKYTGMLSILGIGAEDAGLRGNAPGREEPRSGARGQRQHLRALAKAFPGALRELEMCSPRTIQRRHRLCVAQLQGMAALFGRRRSPGPAEKPCLDLRSCDDSEERDFEALGLSLGWHLRLEDLGIWKQLRPESSGRSYGDFLAWIEGQSSQPMPLRPFAASRWPVRSDVRDQPDAAREKRDGLPGLFGLSGQPGCSDPALRRQIPRATLALDELARRYGYTKMGLRRCLFDRPGPERDTK